MTRRTALYEEHLALKGRMVDFAGWELPVMYSSIIDEHTATRTKAGLFDVSHMGEVIIRGAASNSHEDEQALPGDIDVQLPVPRRRRRGR